MNDPWFMTNHLAAIASMTATSFHHPSVVLHAFFNEGPSDDPAACVGYARSAQAVRDAVGEPPMRLVTWANNHLSADVCIEYEDVISFNSCVHGLGGRVLGPGRGRRGQGGRRGERCGRAGAHTPPLSPPPPPRPLPQLPRLVRRAR